MSENWCDGCGKQCPLPARYCDNCGVLLPGRKSYHEIEDPYPEIYKVEYIEFKQLQLVRGRQQVVQELQAVLLALPYCLQRVLLLRLEQQENKVRQFKDARATLVECLFQVLLQKHQREQKRLTEALLRVTQHKSA